MAHQIFCFKNELDQHAVTKNRDCLLITEDNKLVNGDKKISTSKGKYKDAAFEMIGQHQIRESVKNAKLSKGFRYHHSYDNYQSINTPSNLTI